MKEAGIGVPARSLWYCPKYISIVLYMGGGRLTDIQNGAIHLCGKDAMPWRGRLGLASFRHLADLNEKDCNSPLDG